MGGRVSQLYAKKSGHVADVLTPRIIVSSRQDSLNFDSIEPFDYFSKLYYQCFRNDSKIS